MKIVLLIMAAGVLSLCGCDKTLPENVSVTSERVSKDARIQGQSEFIITNVVRVFLHEPPNHYSVMSMGKGNRLIFHDLNKSTGVSIWVDVPTNQPMWASFTGGDGGTAEIHIHEAGEINGAGWSVKHDKYTDYGTTTVIK